MLPGKTVPHWARDAGHGLCHHQRERRRRTVRGSCQPARPGARRAPYGGDGAARSYILRLASAVPPAERMQEITDQLGGIGAGGRSALVPTVSFHCPTAARKCWPSTGQRSTSGSMDDDGHEHGGYSSSRHSSGGLELGAEIQARQLTLKLATCARLRPGHAYPEEGCRKCYSCGYSEC